MATFSASFALSAQFQLSTVHLFCQVRLSWFHSVVLANGKSVISLAANNKHCYGKISLEWLLCLV